MFRIGITGHRNIEKCNNSFLINNGEEYDKTSWDKTYNDILNSLYNYIGRNNIDLKDVCLVSGMARGADEVLAIIAMDLHVKLLLCVPHSVGWHKKRPYSTGFRAQAINYDKILQYPNLEIIEVPKKYNGIEYQFVNFARNQALVDNTDLMMIYSKYKSVGTDDCVKRIKQANRNHIYV